MRLTADEQALLDGARGEAVRAALAYPVRRGA
jgi:predicted aconitase